MGSKVKNNKNNTKEERVINEEKRNELILALKKKYELLKKKTGLSVDLDDLDKEFIIKDAVLKEGFVPETLLWFLRSRMIDYITSWLGFLHALIIPNPHNLVEVTEASLFNDETKKEIRKLISHIRFLSAENSVVSLSRDDKKEAMMIDKLYKNWVEELKPKIKSLVMKVRDNWKENI